MPIRNGTRKGPSPGFYILGALGSCLVMGIKFMAVAQKAIDAFHDHTTDPKPFR